MRVNHPYSEKYRRQVSRRLRVAFKAAGKTPYEIAERMDIHRSNLFYFMHGDCLPTPVTLLQLSKVLKCKIKDLLP